MKYQLIVVLGLFFPPAVANTATVIIEGTVSPRLGALMRRKDGSVAIASRDLDGGQLLPEPLAAFAGQVSTKRVTGPMGHVTQQGCASLQLTDVRRIDL